MTNKQNFKLVPFLEADPDQTASDISECLQDETTKAQLKSFIPSFPLRTYSESAKATKDRLHNLKIQSKGSRDFWLYVQTLNGKAIGLAVIDARIEAYQKDPAGGFRKIKGLIGPYTSSWIAAPYQGQGLGKESLNQRIEFVTGELGKKGIWTVVANDNQTSNTNVIARGFKPVHRGEILVAGSDYPDATLYQYQARKKPQKRSPKTT